MRGNKRIENADFSPADDNDEKTSQKRILMDLLIETVSKCSDEFDDGVQLQVIKALLTAVTSTHCEVHEGSLLLAVRACFHIHLVSKNQVNKTTAKAALTQMLSVVNQRMESYDARMKAANSTSTGTIPMQSSIPSQACEGDSTGSDVKSSTFGSDFSEGTSDDAAAMAASAAAGFGDSSKIESAAAPVASMSFPSTLHKDSFLLFRALCKLSMKGLHDDTGSTSDPIALQNKILSLELILHMLQHSGPAFRSGERFIFAVRHYLCVSLLGNCTSQVALVTGLSLQIFVALMDGFKDHLKNELEVFITNIFLRILESEYSTLDHKLRVLEVFHNICKEPATQVELFINYDCDLEAIDLFRRTVDGFAKVAKNPSLSQTRSGVDFMSSAGKRIQSEEHMIRMKGLEGLVIVLRSLLRSAGLFTEDISEASSATTTTAGAVGGKSPIKSGSNEGSAAATMQDNNAADDDAGDSDIIAASAVTLQGVDGTNIVEVFDRKQKMAEEIETGILKFNISSKKGLAYLVAHGHIEMTPKSVAAFFRQYQDRLDKTAIGEFLGREKEYENGFNLKVLHEYVDSMDFSGMAFDIAIRYFLNGFRIPGEAQKIDRLMEKFAERYYLQNRDTFASADMAFILAFSTIMLQTNLHNPAIRDDKRMTKEQFIKQNKGISTDGELSDDLLSEIYDRIAAQPISITQDDKANRKAKKDDQSFVVFQTSTDKRRKDAFNHERKEMVRAGEAMFKQKSKANRGSVFLRKQGNSDEAYVRPMFEVVWAPITGVFSQIMETYDDPAMITLCLTGFQYAIRLACRLDFPVARNTFINALAKFTTLETVREMHAKNVECIKVMLDVALYDGEYLEESWSQVLQCISQLARLQLFGSGLHTDDMFFGESQRRSLNNNSSSSGYGNSSSSGYGKSSTSSSISSSSFDPFTKLFSGLSRAETARLVEEANAEVIMREISTVVIDRIFMNSQSLSSESVHHFVESLTAVSMLEITASGGMNSLRGKEMGGDTLTPRVFSLQKLVEVADFNMYSRPRLAWGRIWGLLANHFTTVGTHENQAIAMYAIDSLKQLSIKFLQKDELSNFNFQRVFLKPFEVIMTRSKNEGIRDLVLRCIDIMIRACSSNIRSGWRTIFAIFEVAASQEITEIANIAFEITERLMTSQFELLIYDFVELMNCLVAFAAGAHTTLSIKALNHLAVCADHLAEGAVAPALDAQNSSSDSQGIAWENSKAAVAQMEIGQDASVFRLWWPLLLGLSTRVADNRVQVRVRALETLHHVLRKYGSLFSPQTWAVIFKGVLFPIIDSAKTDFTQQPESSFPTENPAASSNKQSWIGTMGQTVLSGCLELYQMFREKSESVGLLPDMIAMLESCICQETESLARMGARTLNDLVLSLGNEINTTTADLCCNRLSECLIKNLCLDFGDAGFLELVEITPGEVKSVLSECPLVARKRAKEDPLHWGSISSAVTSGSGKKNNIGVGEFVVTAYGDGKLIKSSLPANPLLGLPPRHCIQLSWGLLFTVEPLSSLPRASGISNSTRERDSESSVMMSAAPRLNNVQAWKQISMAAMTSMVMALDFIKIIDIAVQTHARSWQFSHYTSFLGALEAAHWHARSFNDSNRLRVNLNQKGFMQFHDGSHRLPHLLEQEVTSLVKILEITHKLYLDHEEERAQDVVLPPSISRKQAESYAEPWVQKITALILVRYMELESVTPQTISDQFFAEQHAAYTPAAHTAIFGILSFNKDQFARNASWIVPLLSQLILCGDTQLRTYLQRCYEKHVNPRLQYLL